MEELKPCPFCGSDDVSRGHTFQSSLYFVECNNCECGSAHFIDDDGLNYNANSAWQAAVDSWNTRVEPKGE